MSFLVDIYKSARGSTFDVYKIYITLYNDYIIFQTHQQRGENMLKVLGLGDNVVDKYMHIHTMYPGGNALNFAVYARMFGIEAGYLGVFGDDEAASHVYHTVDNLGLDLSHCRFYHGENGYAEVRLDDGDRVFIGSNKGGVSKDYPLYLTKLDADYISGYDIVHTSIFSYVEEQLPAIRKAASFVSMDFSDRADDSYYKRCAPYVDCASISCGDMAEDAIKAQMETIREYGCRHIVIATRGSKGALVWVDGDFYEQSPCLVEAVDTMGAGDSFITCFLVNYVDAMKAARDFPEESGTRGTVRAREYQKLVTASSLYRAAVYSAENCKKDGSFGFGKIFN